MSENTAVTNVVVPDDARALFARLNSLTQNANGILRQIREANSGKSEKIQNLIDTSDVFTDYRAKMARAYEALEKIRGQIELAEAEAREEAERILPETAEIDEAALKEQVMPMRKTINQTKTAIAGLYGEDIFNALVAEFNYEELIGVGRNSSTTVAGTKPRFSSVKLDGVEVTPSTFSELSKRVGIPTEDILAAAKAAAGTDNLKDRAGDVIRFQLTGETKTFAVEVTPK